MLLNLPSITVSRFKEVNDHDYHIQATINDEPGCCSACQGQTFYGHGSKTQLVVDTPMHGRRVGILLERKRYKCRSCGITFIQVCNDINTHGAQATATAQPTAWLSMSRTKAWS